MNLNSPAQLKTTLPALCHQPGNIAILTHSNPDGDGLATALALRVILKQAGYKSDIVLEEIAPDFLDFLYAKENTFVLDENMDYQILILVDCHEPERTGKCSILADKANQLIAIDHHEPQNLNRSWYYYIEPKQVSAGVMIYQTFKHEISRLDISTRRYVTDCLFTTILNDTDGFMNNNTDAEVFRICSELTKLGTKPSEVMEKFLLSNSPAKLKFAGETLSNIRLFDEGRILFMHSTIEQLKQNGLSQEATNKLTRWVKGATGVQVFIYARELRDNSYRLSLRSSSVNCNKICRTFGGGGHNSAAGCVIDAPLGSMIDSILAEVQKYLNE
jgi:bifunctional oligoribonuclease and PAP phosphatase NrnA